MHVGLALLVDAPGHNTMRQLAVELDERYGLGLDAAQLPAHVSLKQPFPSDDLAAVADFFTHFAATVPALSFTFPTVDVLPPPADSDLPGIVWLDVAETPLLRALHDRLNTELAATFSNTAAPFDGPTYRFHATVTQAHTAPRVWSAIKQAYAGRVLDQACTARTLALFYRADKAGRADQWITYRMLPLGGDQAMATF